MINPLALFAGLSSKHKEKILNSIYKPKPGRKS